MKDIIFTDPSKGYEIEVTYKNGDKSSKFFTINQLQKATNYFNKMNNSIDKNVHKVKSKISNERYCLYFRYYRLYINCWLHRRAMCHRGFDERLYELMVWFGWHLSLSSSKSHRITFPRFAMIRFCDEKCE